MPLAYMLDSLRDGSCAKRPSMGGYIKKTVTNEETGAYTLTYKKKDGTTFVYTFNGTSWSAPSTAIEVDGEFHAMMLAKDWVLVDEAEITSGTW